MLSALPLRRRAPLLAALAAGAAVLVWALRPEPALPEPTPAAPAPASPAPAPPGAELRRPRPDPAPARRAASETAPPAPAGPSAEASPETQTEKAERERRTSVTVRATEHGAPLSWSAVRARRPELGMAALVLRFADGAERGAGPRTVDGDALRLKLHAPAAPPERAVLELGHRGLALPLTRVAQERALARGGSADELAYEADVTALLAEERVRVVLRAVDESGAPVELGAAAFASDRELFEVLAESGEEALVVTLRPETYVLHAVAGPHVHVERVAIEATTTEHVVRLVPDHEVVVEVPAELERCAVRAVHRRLRCGPAALRFRRSPDGRFRARLAGGEYDVVVLVDGGGPSPPPSAGTAPRAAVLLAPLEVAGAPARVTVERRPTGVLRLELSGPQWLVLERLDPALPIVEDLVRTAALELELPAGRYAVTLGRGTPAGPSPWAGERTRRVVALDAGDTVTVTGN